METAVEAQITGRVFRVEVGIGDAVEPGGVLLVLESMKMEIPVESPCAGRVRELRVGEGDPVEEGDVLAVIV
jgi:acetyl-CoA carboxylase biotin carboxyl carrier protein